MQGCLAASWILQTAGQQILQVPCIPQMRNQFYLPDLILFQIQIKSLKKGWMRQGSLCEMMSVCMTHLLTSADPSWAFVFPTTLLRLPYSLVCGVIWTCVVCVMPITTDY